MRKMIKIRKNCWKQLITKIKNIKLRSMFNIKKNLIYWE